MTTIRRIAAATGTIAVLTLAGALPAHAAETTGRDFSQHVRMCQASMGFDGTHNPGVMHQGFSNWVPGHMG